MGEVAPEVTAGDRIGALGRFYARFPNAIGALPALIVMAIVVGVTAHAYRQRHTRGEQYLKAALDSHARKDWALCELTTRRAFAHAHGPGRIVLLFQLVDVLYALDRREQADQWLLFLAPEHQRGYPPAHMLLATSLVATGRTESIRLAEVHLRRALEAGYQKSRTTAALFLTLVEIEAPADETLAMLDQALACDDPHLVRVVAALSLWLTRLDDDDPVRPKVLERARRAASAMESRFGPELRVDPTNDLLRARLAMAAQLIGEHERAIQLLEQAEDARSRKTMAPMLARAYLRHARSLGEAHPRYQELVNTALATAPYDVAMLAGILAQGGEEARRVLAFAEAMFAEDAKARRLRFVIGTAMLHNGDADRALPYLEAAFEAHQWSRPAYANNLAMCLVSIREPQVQRSLDLIGRARQLWPSYPKLEETYGRVLARAGRVKEAIRVLEAHLGRGHIDENDTLSELASLYARLGQDRVSARYRERASAATVRRRRAEVRELWGFGDDK